ncbi:MAG: hypothetical protein RR569_03465 [Acinetobacter sp.]
MVDESQLDADLRVMDLGKQRDDAAPSFKVNGGEVDFAPTNVKSTHCSMVKSVYGITF